MTDEIRKLQVGDFCTVTEKKIPVRIEQIAKLKMDGPDMCRVAYTDPTRASNRVWWPDYSLTFVRKGNPKRKGRK